MHLQLVELDFGNVKYYDDKNTKNADEECLGWLERYCERNRKLHAALDEADSIPLNIWPYVYHLASRGGADMLYRHLRDSAGYTLSNWHSSPPPPPKMQVMSTWLRARTRHRHDSAAAKQKRNAHDLFPSSLLLSLMQCYCSQKYSHRLLYFIQTIIN